MKRYLRKAVEYSTEAHAFRILLFVLVLRARWMVWDAFKPIINWVYVRELYIFPPLAFASNYFAQQHYFPDHPIRQMGLLASSFMSATLTLLILRPPKKRFPGHWVGE